jgi:hypothetical protein
MRTWTHRSRELAPECTPEGSIAVTANGLSDEVGTHAARTRNQADTRWDTTLRLVLQDLLADLPLETEMLFGRNVELIPELVEVF